MSGYTKGSWKICYDGQIDSSEGKFICAFRWDSFREFNEGNNADNARLIAAAPDLLEALKLAKLGLEAMVEEERCGETFVATVLTLDKINFVLSKAEAQS